MLEITCAKAIIPLNSKNLKIIRAIFLLFLNCNTGNALLIGVGGSGKQSLSRLAASISSLEVFQVQLRKGYSIADLKLDISQLYIKAGQKNIGCCFLMTDSQVADEKFLVLINDLLASGEIPDLFPEEQVEEIIGALRNEVKSQGIEDTRDNIWKYFIDKVCGFVRCYWLLMFVFGVNVICCRKDFYWLTFDPKSPIHNKVNKERKFHS